MKPLSKDTIDEIDWFASEMVTDFYEPKDQAGRDRMARVDQNGTDLNHLMNSLDMRRESAAPGAEEAYAIVSTDIALRISADLAASHEAGEFPGLASSQFDPSVSLDPRRYEDLSPYEPSRSTLPPLETPYDAAFAEGVVSPETASRLAEAAARAFPDQTIAPGRMQDQQIDNRILMFSHRVERLDRQRSLSTDPETRASYDVVASDLGTRLAVSLKNGLEAGRVHPSRLTREDFAIIENPFAPPAKGLLAQATALSNEGAAAAITKGPAENAAMAAPRSKGAER